MQKPAVFAMVIFCLFDGILKGFCNCNHHFINRLFAIVGYYFYFWESNIREKRSFHIFIRENSAKQYQEKNG